MRPSDAMNLLCPLRAAAANDLDAFRDGAQNCVGDRCMWWKTNTPDTTEGDCAVSALAFALDDIGEQAWRAIP